MFSAKINLKRLLFILGIAVVIAGFLTVSHATYYPAYSKPNLSKSDDEKKEQREKELKEKREKAAKEKNRKEELKKKREEELRKKRGKAERERKKKEEQEKQKQEAKKKKRADELQKKKIEQERWKKKKEQEKKQEEQDTIHRGYKPVPREEPQYRYIEPIVRDYDRDPTIYIKSLRLRKSGGFSRSYFKPNDVLDLEITYRISSYDGFDSVDVLWWVWDESKRQVHSSRTSFSLRSDQYVTEVIHNAVDLSRMPGSSRFSVKVEVEVENRRTQRKVDGRISGVSANFRLLDAYLTTDRSHDRYYPGFPASSFNDGDPFWLVIEYDIDGYPHGDVEVEYKLYNKYDHTVFHDSFWTKAYRGKQVIDRRGWVPQVASSANSRFTLQVKVKYKNSIKISRSYYSIRSKYDYYDYSHSNSYYRPDSISHRGWLTEVYPCKNARGRKTGRNFYYDDDIYLILKYNPFYRYSENIMLNWVIFDSNDTKIIIDARYVKVSNDGTFPVKLVAPESLQPGRYRYVMEVEGLQDEPGDIKRTGEFEVFEQKEGVEPQNTNPENIDEDSIIEYQIDNRMVVNLPASWQGEFNYDDRLPPFVFAPGKDVRGMILTYEFENKEYSLEQAIEFFEEIESKATGIENHIVEMDITLGDQPARLRSYNGKVTHQGEFLEENIEEIEIALVFLLDTENEKDTLYVIRLIAPWGNLSSLIDTATSFSDRVSFTKS